MLSSCLHLVDYLALRRPVSGAPYLMSKPLDMACDVVLALFASTDGSTNFDGHGLRLYGMPSGLTRISFLFSLKGLSYLRSDHVAISIWIGGFPASTD